MGSESGDLLLANGRIWLAPPAAVTVPALLVRQGRVAAVGELADLRARAPSVPELDLQGATVLPGLIDAHCHLIWYGESRLRWVDLRGVSSIDELLGRLRARLETRPPAPGEWVLGRGFDQDRLEGCRMPTDSDLDSVSTSVPLVIERVCGHALVASTRAQELSGVQAPGGFLAEGDMDPVWRAVPPPSPEARLAAAELACHEAASVGFTGIHCIVSCREEIEALRALARRGPLPIHARLMASDVDLLDPPQERQAVPCRTLKLFADGSLGAHTAALADPYTDMPETSGRLLLPLDELSARVLRAHRAGHQVAVHAIGDAAVATAVSAIEAAQASAPRPDPRHRIEHASVLPPPLVSRLAASGIIAAVQPQFVVSDFWTGARLGPARASWAYPFASLLRAGVRVAGSTDCPVEALDPFQALSRAVGRQSEPERLTVPEAVGLFTAGAAFAGFQEGDRGSLRPGCWADLIVVPEDPRSLGPDAIAALRPELTLCEGRVVHAAGRFAGAAGEGSGTR